MKMRKKHWTIGVVLLLVGLAISFHLVTAGDAKSAVAGPHIEFDERLHDFGLITQGDKLLYEYKVRNGGTQMLHLGEVKTLIGCCPKEFVKAEASANQIEPGGHANIRLSVDTTRRPGGFLGRIVVKSNDPENAESVLHFGGRVKREIRVVPAELKIEVLPSQGGEAQLAIAHEGDGKLRIEQVETSADDIRVNYFNPVSLSYNQTIRIDVEIAPLTEATQSIASGPREESVTIHTNSKSLPELGVPVTVAYRESLRAQPSRIFFNLANHDQRAAGLSLSITSRDNRSFAIEKVRTPEIFEAVAETSLGQKSADHDIQIMASLENAPESSGSAAFVFITDHPFQRTLTVPVSWVDTAGMGDEAPLVSTRLSSGDLAADTSTELGRR